MAVEKTLILVKPDGVRRALIGEIISGIENKGLKIRGLKMLQIDEALAAQHYAEHVEKPFFPELREFVLSGPVVGMIIEGDEAIAVMRKLMGATKFSDAEPGAIRGDYAYNFTENLVHGSDSPESAAREMALYFNDSEIF